MGLRYKIAFIAGILFSLLTTAQNQNISNGFIFEGEPYLAVNPDNEDHLVIAWMGFVNAGSRIQIKVRTSFDAGNTWSNGIAIPHVSSGYTAADPSIAFDVDGNVVLAFIDSTGTDSNPIEGGIYISKSNDGGLSFSNPTEVLNINAMPAQRIIDRPWIVIDRSNSANQNTIYVTSMNVRDSQPEFHPYVSVSTNGGTTFALRTVDRTGWLSGDLIRQPMPTPAITSTGTFYAVYPSFVLSQNQMAQYIVASSDNAGSTFSYNTVFASNASNSNNDPLPKKGYLLIDDPSDANHLAFLFLSNLNDDLDIYFTETLNAGLNWTTPFRVNDDPIANDRMQDLVWGDFNETGALIVSWRDRRNAPTSGYETASEIWAAYRAAGSNAFEPNFQITDQTVDFDDVLLSAGNDFMGIQLVNEIVHTTWGDPRSGSLNIWYQKLATDGTILSVTQIAAEQFPTILVYPNPAKDTLFIEARDIKKIQLFTSEGKEILVSQNILGSETRQLNVSNLSAGVYHLRIRTSEKEYSHTFIVE